MAETLPSPSTEIARMRAEILHWRTRLWELSVGLKPSESPATGHDAIVSLGLRIGSLASLGMMGAAEGDAYAAWALARLVSEHWVRLMVLFADTQKRGDPASGERYWKSLKRAEAVNADRVVRSWFPSGFDYSALPEPVRVQLGAILLDPSPSKSEVEDARVVIGKFGHRELVNELYGGLPSKGPVDHHAYGSLLASYSVQSAFVHGGPDGHDVLVGDSWSRCLDVTVDIAIAWVSALIFIHTHLAGGVRAESVVKARLLQADIMTWYRASAMKTAAIAALEV